MIMTNRLNKYFKFLNQQKYPLRTILSTFFLKSGFHKFLKIHLRGYKLYFHRAALSRLLWVDPHIRDHDLDFLKYFLREGDIVIDVGANIGFTVLEASKAVGNNGKIYAFEPHPRIFNFLSSNITLNQSSNIQLFNIALGSYTGKISFMDGRSSDRNRPDKKGSITVELTTLDTILDDLESIDLLKIDVEGYEKYVLEGSKNVLSRTQMIYFEVCNDFTKHFDYSGLELIKLIQDSGFNLFQINHQLHPKPLLDDFQLFPGQVIDLLGVRDINKLYSRVKL